jgi:hypothetical protein
MLEELIQEICQEVSDLKLPHALVIQDTTEVNFYAHSGRLLVSDPDIGPLTAKDKSAGFFLHPGLVVDPVGNVPLGISSITIWNRRFGEPDKHERKYKTRPIDEKESIRWINTGQNSAKQLPHVEMLTIIGDREADIYDEFWRLPDARTHLLIRSSENRKLFKEDKLLFDYLNDLPACGCILVPIEHNPKRKSRTARMCVHYGKVRIAAPAKKGAKDAKDEKRPPFVELHAVYVHELPDSVPPGEEPIVWRLLTTHAVLDMEMALLIIEWYKLRWLIEELFRVLKSKGLQLEESQLEHGAALKKLTILALQTAQQALLLKQVRNGQPDLPAETLYKEEELIFIDHLNDQLQGKTIAQQNPHPKSTLAYVAWVIARLGGWKGYSKSEGPPGVITMIRGVIAFNQQFEGWTRAMRFFKQNSSMFSSNSS